MAFAVPGKPDCRILLTGISGQVGHDLQPYLARLGEVIAPGREKLDLARPEQIRKVVRELRPHWIINPAAYTAVDKAETEPELAFAINRDAASVLAEEAKRIGAALIHFSTDYVFDGGKAAPYVETDAVNPLNVYGSSKLAGEQAIQQSGAAHLIFRTSWVYSMRGRNFLRAILKLAGEREELRIVNDQHGAPTWSRDLAMLTAHVMEKIEIQSATTGASLAETASDLSGLYHACSAGETTWFGFAEEALRLCKMQMPQTHFAKLTPIPTSDYPTLALRPLNSRLDCGKLAVKFGMRIPAWDKSLNHLMVEAPFESVHT